MRLLSWVAFAHRRCVIKMGPVAVPALLRRRKEKALAKNGVMWRGWKNKINIFEMAVVCGEILRNILWLAFCVIGALFALATKQAGIVIIGAEILMK